MSGTQADDIHAKAYSMLLASGSKPAGLTSAAIRDYPIPEQMLEEPELPLVGVYIAAGDTPVDDSTGFGEECTTDLIVEIHVLADHPLRGTRAFRDWVKATLFPEDGPVLDTTLQGIASHSIYRGFKPFGAVKDAWKAGAFLTFEVHHFPDA